METNIKKIVGLMAKSKPEEKVNLDFFNHVNHGGLGYTQWTKSCMRNRHRNRKGKAR